MKIYMKSNRIPYDAVGEMSGKKVTVLKGSKIHLKCKEYINYPVSPDGTLLEDIPFDSPSTAAKFVCGRSANGWVEWRLDNGEAIQTIRDNLAFYIAQNEMKNHYPENTVKESRQQKIIQADIPKNSCHSEFIPNFHVPESLNGEVSAEIEKKYEEIERRLDTYKKYLYDLRLQLTAMQKEIDRLKEDKSSSAFRSTDMTNDCSNMITAKRDSVFEIKCLDSGKTISGNSVVLHFNVIPKGLSEDTKYLCYMRFYDESLVPLSEEQEIELLYPGKSVATVFTLSESACGKKVMYLIWRQLNDPIGTVRGLFSFKGCILFPNAFY